MSQELTKSQEPELIVTGTGKPFATEQAAKMNAGLKGIADPVIVKHQDGFAIVKPESDADDDAAPVAPMAPDVEPVAKEKCYRVQFQAKSTPNDTKDVELSVNGEQIILQRQVPVVIPERYVECARNATYPQYEQKPGRNRKIVGHVRVYPFDVLGESSWDEYEQMKREGTKKSREDVDRYGREAGMDD